MELWYRPLYNAYCWIALLQEWLTRDDQDWNCFLIKTSVTLQQILNSSSQSDFAPDFGFHTQFATITRRYHFEWVMVQNNYTSSCNLVALTINLQNSAFILQFFFETKASVSGVWLVISIEFHVMLTKRFEPSGHSLLLIAWKELVKSRQQNSLTHL